MAFSLSNLGDIVSKLGRPAEALPAAEEAVAIWRELAAADSAKYRPGLASSLANLGDIVSKLGRPAEALPAAEEAVAIWRELAAGDLDQYHPALAYSLATLSTIRQKLHQTADADSMHAEVFKDAKFSGGLAYLSFAWLLG
jgi:tetratricopeptide (TPR) repeat protein